MKCPVCRATRLVEINLTVAGSAVRMQSCSRCDRRWWDRDGQPVARDAVLELVAVPRRSR